MCAHTSWEYSILLPANLRSVCALVVVVPGGVTSTIDALREQIISPHVCFVHSSLAQRARSQRECIYNFQSIGEAFVCVRLRLISDPLEFRPEKANLWESSTWSEMDDHSVHSVQNVSAQFWERADNRDTQINQFLHEVCAARVERKLVCNGWVWIFVQHSTQTRVWHRLLHFCCILCVVKSTTSTGWLHTCEMIRR